MEQMDTTFIKRVAELTGDEVYKCYQCQRCSAGCPVAEFMDYLPAQIIRLCQLGFKKTIFNSKSIWLCASCETCTTRCPNEVDIAMIMDAMRQECISTGSRPAVKEVFLFHRIFLDSIKSFGRVHEAGLLAKFKLKSGKIFDDLKLGMDMYKKGKIKLFPHRIKGIRDIKKMIK